MSNISQFPPQPPQGGVRVEVQTGVAILREELVMPDGKLYKAFFSTRLALAHELGQVLVLPVIVGGPPQLMIKSEILAGIIGTSRCPEGVYDFG